MTFTFALYTALCSILLLLLLLLLLLFCRLTPVLPEVKAGGFDETFFPPFLRPASTAHSLWATISCDLCQTVILHSPHTGIPLSSSGLGPFIDILNCA